ncbi:hypothetical protein BDP81DRAFT_163572 [Colletotrichum phormii]|uniref:Uncharacterized protein n=1 Tax=Colletotrichum phormii TaxID=359342 RepID=A0AAJ0EKW6_9PEZI|nr:uncharacterized protein BDP81DRAFT_163572 [Colletotrichum phormii]KAK1640451.1 hypothetical protein BDP81DRAFT_163572 [Colletotrichum phormii]
MTPVLLPPTKYLVSQAPNPHLNFFRLPFPEFSTSKKLSHTRMPPNSHDPDPFYRLIHHTSLPHYHADQKPTRNPPRCLPQTLPPSNTFINSPRSSSWLG